MSDDAAVIHPVIYQACEAVGEMMELWGFKKIHGMVWTYIFLASQPQTAHDIRAGLGISTGLASMTLADLARWGVVHRRSPPGERRDFYEAEANIWRPILKVLREREFYKMNETVETIRGLQQALAAGSSPAEHHAAARLAELIQLGELAQRLFGQFLELGDMVMRDTARMTVASGLGQTLLALRRFISREGVALGKEPPAAEG